jgi:Rrf2 family iron-sulfur cluster assembly transcriptional regulator
MQISTRGRYAVAAMAELACREAGGVCRRPVTLAEIAARNALSQCYLEQLFGRLRRAELVAATRGPGGGYRLTRAASAITIAEIMAAAEENLQPCPDAASGAGAVDALWLELGRHVHLFLHRLTLADVIAGAVQGRARASVEAAE